MGWIPAAALITVTLTLVAGAIYAVRSGKQSVENEVLKDDLKAVTKVAIAVSDPDASDGVLPDRFNR